MSRSSSYDNEKSTKKRGPNFGKTLRREKQKLLMSVGKRSEAELSSDADAAQARSDISSLSDSITSLADSTSSYLSCFQSSYDALLLTVSAFGEDDACRELLCSAHESYLATLRQLLGQLHGRLDSVSAVKKLADHRDKVRLDALSARHDVDSAQAKVDKEVGNAVAQGKLEAAKGKLQSMEERLSAITSQVLESLAPLVSSKERDAAAWRASFYEAQGKFHLACARATLGVDAVANVEEEAAAAAAAAATVTAASPAQTTAKASSKPSSSPKRKSTRGRKSTSGASAAASRRMTAPQREDEERVHAVAAIARFDSKTTSEKELTFRRGDRLRVLAEGDRTDWLRGELEDGTRGWVGAQFVRRLNDANATSVPATVRRYRRAIYSHAAREDDELSFLEDDVIEVLDDGGASAKDTLAWYRGRMYSGITKSFEEGLFPCSYTKEIPASDMHEAEALHHFIPREPTELQLTRGERYLVLLEEGGWARGTPLVGDGRIAEFPRQHVRYDGETEEAEVPPPPPPPATSDDDSDDEGEEPAQPDDAAPGNADKDDDEQSAEPGNDGADSAPLDVAIALYDFDARDETEISFAEGDRIIIVQRDEEDENWVHGYVESDPDKRVGEVATTYLEQLS